MNFGFWALKETAIFWVKPYNNKRSQYLIWEEFEGPYYFIGDVILDLLMFLRKPHATLAVYEKMAKCGISQEKRTRVLAALERIGVISYSKSSFENTGDIRLQETISSISSCSNFTYLVFIYYVSFILLIAHICNLFITRFPQLHNVNYTPAFEHFFQCLLVIIAFATFHEVAHGTMHYLFTRKFPKPICLKPMTNLLMLPAPKVNLNLTYLLDSRLQRIAILSAGLYADCICIWFSFTMINTTNQAPLWICLTWASIISFVLNLLPLWTSDGYYILTEVLQLPNMNSRAEKALQNLLLGKQNRPILLILHGVAKVLFEIIALVVFLIFFYKVFNLEEKLDPVFLWVFMVLIFSWYIFEAILQPIKNQKHED